jgi:peptidoglycan/LPS O-acetylase OafA/YrhL
MMNRDRIEYLDVYRALAILAVLLIHTTSSAVGSLSRDSLLYPMYVAVNSAAHFAVPAFLFLSSLVLLYNYDGRAKINWSTFYRRRLWSIIVPYVLWSGFYFLLVNRNHGLRIIDNWPVFFKGLLDGSNYTHLYFIVIIVQFLLVFPLFLRFTQLRWVRPHLITFGIVLQTAFYLGNYYFFHIHKIGTFASSYLLYFFLGAYAGIALKSSKSWIDKPKPALYGAAIMLAAVYVAQIWMQMFHTHYIPQPWLSWVNYLSVYGYCSVCCLLLIHTSSWLFASGQLVRRFMVSLGVASFGIYFIHPLILFYWRSKVMMNGPFLYPILILGGGIVALLLSWLLTELIQRAHLGNLLFGREKTEAKGVTNGR